MGVKSKHHQEKFKSIHIKPNLFVWIMLTFLIIWKTLNSSIQTILINLTRMLWSSWDTSSAPAHAQNFMQNDATTSLLIKRITNQHHDDLGWHHKKICWPMISSKQSLTVELQSNNLKVVIIAFSIAEQTYIICWDTVFQLNNINFRLFISLVGACHYFLAKTFFSLNWKFPNIY